MQLIVNNLRKVYGTSTPLVATLLDDNDNPRVGVSVSFTINGVSYTRTTNSDGIARLNINLGVGDYKCTVTCLPLSKTVNVTVVDKFNVSLLVNPLTKTYGVSGGLKATLYGEHAEPLTGRRIQYTINGVSYNRTTNSDGQTSLAINLRPGTYPCEVKFLGDAEYGASSQTVNVTVKADTFIDGTDVDKKYSDAGFFQCAVYDQWERLNPVTVTLTVNGVSYTRTSGKDGLVKLNIRLQPGEYALTVRFLGDAKHNGSTLTKLVRVRSDIDTITTKADGGYTIPSNNRGFIESKIYAGFFGYQSNKKNNWIYDIPDWDLILTLEEGVNFYDIKFTNYEITETDGRVKTAKFTTPLYMDLTYGRGWVYITSPYHENFGGRVLKVDYDKSTGLYTYQCQDGRRQYISKRRMMGAGENTTVYELLQLLLMSPAWHKKGNPSKSNLVENSKKHAELLSGLHPIGDYDNLKLSPILKGDNPFKQKVGQYLAYDSTIDQITNLAKNGQYPIDVWFDPSGICHIDPIDLDKWLSQGIRLVHSDLISYKYGFDTTNILTGVTLKSKDEENASGYYDEFAELTYFFGVNFGSVDPVTTTTSSSSTGGTSSSDTSSTSNTNTVASGLMSGKKTFAVGQDNGVVPHYRLTLINKLRAAGHTVIDLGVGPNKNQSFGQTSRAKGVIDIFVCNGICCGTHHDYMLGMKSGNYKYSHVIFTWVRGDIEMSRKQAYAWDWYYGDIGLDKSITRHEFFVRYKDKMSYVNLWPDGNGSFPLSPSDWEKQCDAIVAGKFNNNSGGVVSSSSSSSNTNSNTTTTVVDTVATYNKALEAVSQSVRDLLSFEIELPLNNPVFKNLHTNQMLWTELPKEFKLRNLNEIFKIMKSWKSARGIPYQENRWYVEKLVIKHDGKGPIAKITLNPFPSSYSVYSNAVKSYAEAYDQAFKQNTTTENTSSTTTSTTGGAGTPKLGNDSTSTSAMACMTGGGYGHSGHGRNFDTCCKKGYAQQGRKYYEWARQYKSPTELAKALNNIYREASPVYYNHRFANAESTFNNGHPVGNCWDGCRLVKCCFDAAGFDCVVITGTIYGWGHGWNAIKYNGKWYTFDVLFDSRGSSTNGTNSIRAVW